MTLHIEGLTKRFGAHTLFEGLTLRVEAPAVLWAPSGWGKTTLLRILMGLEHPDAGRAAGAGRVAAVFQEDRLCPQLSAVELVRLVLPDGRARRAAVEADFALLGMTGEALTLPAARLSGGQKRRAALLRAVWAKADTRLFDEPFTGLDPPRPRRHRSPRLAGPRPGSPLGPDAARRSAMRGPAFSFRVNLYKIQSLPQNLHKASAPQALFFCAQRK